MRDQDFKWAMLAAMSLVVGALLAMVAAYLLWGAK